VLILLIYNSYDDKYYKELYDWGPEKKHSLQEVYIDYQKISHGSDGQLNDMFSLFVEHAIDFIPAVSMALEKIRVHKIKKPKKRIAARFFNVNKFYSINDIKSSMISQYVSIKGVVLRTSPIKLLITGITFQCLECKINMVRRFPDGIFIQPTFCDNDGCKSKIFIPDKTTSQSILYQRVRIQEINDEASIDNSGRLPKSIECELKENLVSSVVSGDIVVVNGVLKTERAEDSESRAFNVGKNKVQGLFVSYVDANTVINVKYQEKHLNHNNEDEFSEDDMKIIEALANTRNIFPLLVRSFCPTIYGQELVKAGIILAITGGSNLEEADKEANNSHNTKYRTSIRPDCHILIIGDPGQGKSQMLKFVSNIVPRGVYVCGNATSNAGLTVAVTKDAHTGEGSLEAGALVLSDQGVCCIDEFDKMSSEHLSLLEAMEQQTVSIAKSGVMCSLSTRTTIVAAANPKGGHYNKSKNVKDNIKISNAILSRFDLVFLLLDHPDPCRDQKLSEHVMKLHNTKKRKRDQFESYEDEGKANPTASGNITFTQFQTKFTNNFYNFKNKGLSPFPGEIQKQKTPEKSNFNSEKFCSLTERLTAICDQFTPNQVLDQNIFRKYIAYIKRNIHPYLTPEAGEVIKTFFVSLRENSDSNNSLTTTTRQLESLIRLSQARAKLECRTEVTEQDAMDVVDLMQESLFDALEDLSGGGVSIKGARGKAVNMNNIGILSVPKQTKLFIDKLREEAKMKNSFLFEYQDLLGISRSMNMNVGDFSEYIDKLNQQSYLILKGSKLYELNSKY